MKSVLRENNYPSSFINNCERSLSKPPADLPTNGFVVLPYVQGISEKIGCILRQQEIKVAYKPLKTVNSLFPRPKFQNDVDRPRSGVVYKINCTNCNFVYCGQTERPLKTRITEHKRAVAMFDHDSKISCHVHENNHHMDCNAVSVVGHEPDYHKRLLMIHTLGTTTLSSQRFTSLCRAHEFRATFFSFKLYTLFLKRALMCCLFKSRITALTL